MNSASHNYVKDLLKTESDIFLSQVEKQEQLEVFVVIIGVAGDTTMMKTFSFHAVCT